MPSTRQTLRRACPVCVRQVIVSPSTQRVHRHGPPGDTCPGTNSWIDLYGERRE